MKVFPLVVLSVVSVWGSRNRLVGEYSSSSDNEVEVILNQPQNNNQNVSQAVQRSSSSSDSDTIVYADDQDELARESPRSLAENDDLPVNAEQSDKHEPMAVYEFDAIEFFTSLTPERADLVISITPTDPINAAALNDPDCIRAIRAVCKFIPTVWFRELLLTDPNLVSDETIGAILRGECFESIGQYGWIEPGDPIHRIPLIAWDAIRGGARSFNPLVLLDLLERDPERLSQSFLQNVLDMYSIDDVQSQGNTSRITPPIQLRFILLLKHMECSSWIMDSNNKKQQLRSLARSVASNLSSLIKVPLEHILAAGLVIVEILPPIQISERILDDWKTLIQLNLATKDGVLNIARKLLASTKSNDLRGYIMRNIFEWLLKHAPQEIPSELVDWAFKETTDDTVTSARRVHLFKMTIQKVTFGTFLIDKLLQLMSAAELQLLIHSDPSLLPLLLAKPLDPDSKLALIDVHNSANDGGDDFPILRNFLTNPMEGFAGPEFVSNAGFWNFGDADNMNAMDRQDPENDMNDMIHDIDDVIRLVSDNPHVDIAQNIPQLNNPPGVPNELEMPFLHLLQNRGRPPIQIQVIHMNSHIQPRHNNNNNNISNPGNYYEWLPMERLIALEKNAYIVYPDDVVIDLKRQRKIDESASSERELYKEAIEIAKAIKEDVKAKAQRLVHSTVLAFREDEGNISDPSFRIIYVEEIAPLTSSLGRHGRLDALENTSRYRRMGNDQSALRKDWLHKVFFLLGGTCLGGVLEAHANDADGGLVPVPFVDPEAIGLLGRMCGKMLQLRIRPGLHWHGLILTILDPSRYPDDLIEEPTLRLLYPTVFARLDDLLAKSENPETLDECGWELYPSADGQMLPFRIITWSFERPMNAGLNAEYVKAESRMQVVDYVSSYILQLGMHLAEVLKAFQRGLMKYFDFAQYGKFFTPVDIMHILLGPTSEALSADHLLKALIFDHSCQGHQLINNLSSGQILQQNVSMREAIELVLRSFSPEEIVQFWNFLSPTPTIPIGGLASVRPTIVCAHLDLDHLPKASTCFYTITFPRYPSVLVLLKKLLYAMYNGTSVAFED